MGLVAFENRPIGLVSVLDITEAADVAKGVFYLHFGSKDEYLVALWKHVQKALLAGLRQKLDGCSSGLARIEVVARHYHGMIAHAPRECRFRLRMSSYFGDEIGQPGQLTRLRREYLEELAALLHDVPMEDVGPREIRSATIIHAVSWGLILQAIHSEDHVLDESSFIKAVTGTARSLEGD